MSDRETFGPPTYEHVCEPCGLTMRAYSREALQQMIDAHRRITHGEGA